ncbi:GNAT family protein [Roseateles sp.]|uniref:GNAT family N-acetyltransferase n=1 Tax=Roseateles sp. TaxID=1971397 RepID=UPI0031DB1C6C
MSNSNDSRPGSADPSAPSHVGGPGTASTSSTASAAGAPSATDNALVQLRLLGEGDLVAYKALRDAMLAAHEEAFTSDAATERAREAASYRARLHPQAGGKSLFTLGAWIGDQLVGALTVEHENRVKVRHVAHLIGMMVDDAHAGRGIGGLLLRQALTLLKREPLLETLTLSVTAGNAPAMALYRRVGFTRYGHLPRAIRLSDGRFYAKDLMSLDLRS